MVQLLLIENAGSLLLMYNDTKNIVDPWIKERGYISAIQQRPYAFSMNNS
jgi:hypothetical protein